MVNSRFLVVNEECNRKENSEGTDQSEREESLHLYLASAFLKRQDQHMVKRSRSNLLVAFWTSTSSDEVAMDILKYLADMPRVSRSKLLKTPHCCLAIYGGLSERDRLLVSRLLAGPSHYRSLTQPESDTNAQRESDKKDKNDLEADEEAGDRNFGFATSQKLSTAGNRHHEHHTHPAQKILAPLWDLGVLELDGDIISLEDAFGDQLYVSLSGPNSALSEVSLPSGVTEDISLNALVDFAKQKWEGLVTPLIKLANPLFIAPSRSRANAEQLRSVLEQAGLIRENEDGVDEMTSEGYTFLLSEIPKQVWTLTNSFLTKVVEPQARASSTSFLILVAASLIPGKIYSVDNIDKMGQSLDILKNLEIFGLVRFVTPKTRSAEKYAYFTVTPLSNAMLEGQGGSNATVRIGDWSSGIIVESNFYLYLYTTSSIMVALIELFSHISVRMPNMCVARLTRQSVRSAFRKGIHSAHVISYLRANKHSAHTSPLSATGSSLQATSSSNSKNSALSLAQALAHGNDSYDMEAMFPTSKESGLPEQVEDQLRLWEDERFRFLATEVVQWDFEPDYDDPTWYALVKEYAQDIDALVWSNDLAGSLSIKLQSQEPMVAFYRSLQAQAGKS